MDEAVYIVLGDSVGYSLCAFDMDIFEAKISGIVRKVPQFSIPRVATLLGSPSLLDYRPHPSAVRFPPVMGYSSDRTPSPDRKFQGQEAPSARRPHQEDYSTKVTRNLQVPLRHFVPEGNHNCASSCRCGPSAINQASALV